MKASKIIWGILIVAAAVLLILQGVGVLGNFTSVVGEIAIWKIVLAVFLLAAVIDRIVRLRFDHIFVPLGFIFMLFEENIAVACGIGNDGNIINNWIVFVCSLLLSAGVGLLIPKRRKKFKVIHHTKKKRVKVELDNDEPIAVEVEEPEADEPEYDEDEDEDEDEESDYGRRDFGVASTRYFDGATFKKGYVKTSMGATEISFENADKYRGGGVLEVDCRMGALEINVPQSWKVVVNIDTTLGAIDNSHRNKDANAPVLTITGRCHLGAVEIE